MFCHIIFRDTVKKTVCAALSMRKQCNKLHGKDMRQKMPVFTFNCSNSSENLCVKREKLFDDQHHDCSSPISHAGIPQQDSGPAGVSGQGTGKASDQLQIMLSCGDPLLSREDDCSLSCT